MTRMYLVRHGATALNLEQPYRLQGRGIDAPLDAVGVHQAERTRAALRAVPIHLIVSSPLLRAKQTADLIAAPHGLAVQTEPAIIEGDVGRWEGQTWDQVRAVDLAAFEAFQADPVGRGYPEGENFRQVFERVRPALRRIASESRETHIVVVTHQIVCRVLVGNLLGLEGTATRRLKLANGGISVVDWSNDEPAVVTVNSILHLA